MKMILEKWTKLSKRAPHYLNEDEWDYVKNSYSSLYIMMIGIDAQYSIEKLHNLNEMVILNFNMIAKKLDNKKTLLIWTEFYNSIDELLEDYELIEEYKICQNIYDFKKILENGTIK